MDLTHLNLEIIAHRGFSAVAPENTLAAFNAAIQNNADSVEFDVQLSADKVPIIFHDVTLDRLTGTSGKVQEKTLAELQTCDVGLWFSERYRGEKIPSLKEALATLKNFKKFLYFDVKPHCDWSDLEVEDLVKLLRTEGILDRCIITSFSHQFLDQIQQSSPDLKIGHIVANEENFITQLDQAVVAGHKVISSQYRILLNNPALIEQSRSQGIDLVAWTVDSREDFQKLVDLGIVRIITNSLIGQS